MEKTTEDIDDGRIFPFFTVFTKFGVHFYKIQLVETQFTEVYTSIALNKLLYKIGKISNLFMS